MLKFLFFIIFTVLQNRADSVKLVKPVASDWVLEKSYPRNCFEATIKPAASDIYLIQLDNYKPHPFLVSCERGYDSGGWTVIQRRINGEIDFYRGWNDYKFGFGDLTGEFWIGLEKLHALTTDSIQELLIVMEDFDGEIRTAKYDLFAIGNENEGFALKLLGNFSGTAGDSLKYHKSYKFTTLDKNYSERPSNCAKDFTGAWWYKACHESNLNGQYLKGQHDKFGQSVSWYTWRGHNYSLKFTQMMIRPRF